MHEINGEKFPSRHRIWQKLLKKWLEKRSMDFKKKIGQENDSGRGRRRLFSEFIHWSPRPNCIEGLHANVDFTPTRLSLNHFSWSWWKWKKYKYHQKAAESPVTCSLRVNLYGVLVVPQCWGWNSWRHTARPQAAFPGQRL